MKVKIKGLNTNMKITLSEDKDLVAEIQTQMKENGGYCVCRREKTSDSKCMCKEFRDQIAAGIEGECHCGLYVAKKKED